MNKSFNRSTVPTQDNAPERRPAALTEPARMLEHLGHSVAPASSPNRTSMLEHLCSPGTGAKRLLYKLVVVITAKRASHE